MEKDARARRDGKKKGGGLGKSGGLARLGLKIEAKEGAVGAKVPVQKQVDSFLANMGIDVDYVAAESEQKKKHAAKKLEAAKGKKSARFQEAELMLKAKGESRAMAKRADGSALDDDVGGPKASRKASGVNLIEGLSASGERKVSANQGGGRKASTKFSEVL